MLAAFSKRVRALIHLFRQPLARERATVQPPWENPQIKGGVTFYKVGKSAVPGLKKKPSTSELLDWLKLLMVEDIGAEILRERDPKKLIPPLHGALLKNEQDVHLFERLAFMARREGR